MVEESIAQPMIRIWLWLLFHGSSTWHEEHTATHDVLETEETRSMRC
jgi:hypothetical protein